MKLVTQPTEMMLDFEFSHPVMDTCNFKKFNKALPMRLIVIDYLLRNPQYASHLELMETLVSFILKSSNGIGSGIQMYNEIRMNTNFNNLVLRPIELSI
jgi:hypothetical protein